MSACVDRYRDANFVGRRGVGEAQLHKYVLQGATRACAAKQARLRSLAGYRVSRGGRYVDPASMGRMRTTATKIDSPRCGSQSSGAVRTPAKAIISGCFPIHLCRRGAAPVVSNDGNASFKRVAIEGTKGNHPPPRSLCGCAGTAPTPSIWGTEGRRRSRGEQGRGGVHAGTRARPSRPSREPAPCRQAGAVADMSGPQLSPP